MKLTEAYLRTELTRICDPETCYLESPIVSTVIPEHLIERTLDLHVVKTLAAFDEVRSLRRPMVVLKFKAEVVLRAALRAASLRYGSTEKILDVVADSLMKRILEWEEDDEAVLPCHHIAALREGSLPELFPTYARVLLDDTSEGYKRVLRDELAEEMFMISLALQEDIEERDRKASSRSGTDNLVTPLPL